jgi:hypothetical protein
MHQDFFLVLFILGLLTVPTHSFFISRGRPRSGRSFSSSLSERSDANKGRLGGVPQYLHSEIRKCLALVVVSATIVPILGPTSRVVGARVASAEVSTVLAAEKVDPINASIEKKIKEDSQSAVSEAAETAESEAGAEIPGVSGDVERELESMEEDMEMNILRGKRKPDQVMKSMKIALTKAAKESASIDVEKGFTSEQQKFLDNCRDRVLTLKAYLDEAQRDMVSRNWENLQVYIFTFAEQEDAFVGLINGLFPQDDPLDRAAREALSFEAQSMFVNLDDLREAAKVGNVPKAQRAYASLLLSYDRFLKAGDMYETYDPITSTAIFFKDQPLSTLEFDKEAKVQVYDSVLLLSGPDMGKTGTVINIEGDNVVLQLDKDGKAYQEVKQVKLDTLAKAIEGDCDEKCQKEKEKEQYKQQRAQTKVKSLIRGNEIV